MSPQKVSSSDPSSNVLKTKNNFVERMVLMFLMLFLLCISYSILRNAKDALVLTAKESGAEVLPFLKVWGILPGTICAAWLYTFLSQRFTREKVFYIVIGSFNLYFLFFSFFLYPNSEFFHLPSVATKLAAILPEGFSGMIAMVRNWTFSSFYVVCELWAIQLLTVLFWGYANETMTVDEGKRYYGYLNVGSNIAPLFGGFIAILVVDHLSLPMLSVADLPWSESLRKLMTTVFFISIITTFVFYRLNRMEVGEKDTKVKKQKLRYSLRECLSYLSASPYLTGLAMIVVGYNLSINLTDTLWKSQLRSHYSNPDEILNHMSYVNVVIGSVATCGALIFSVIVRKLGWRFVALITPVVMAFTALGFFAFFFFPEQLSPLSVGILGASPLLVSVYFGSMQNAFSKGNKYSVFDASKELAFLPLTAEDRYKGKAAIDGLGSAVGKSGASLSYQVLIIVFGGVAQSTPAIACILFVAITAWIFAVLRVGNKFTELTAK